MQLSLARPLGDDGRSQSTTENRQKEKGGEKGKPGKAHPPKAADSHGYTDSSNAKPARRNKEVKAENTAKPADPDDIYATLDWDTNPPINGFYEMMMGLTPERRKELRELARQHNEKQVAAEKTEVKAVPETSREQPTTGGNTAGGSRRTCRYRYPIGSGGDFPFSPTSKRKSRRRKSWTFLRVPTTARRRCTCAKGRWWLTGGVITSAT